MNAGTCRIGIRKSDCLCHFLERSYAVCIAAFATSTVKRNENNRGQDADDGDDHQEFDEGEATLLML